jgi:hypothetical protein
MSGEVKAFRRSGTSGVVHLRVVVHALGNGDTRRGVDVTGEQGVDVVLHGQSFALVQRQTRSRTTPPCRALTTSERSGGRALRHQQSPKSEEDNAIRDSYSPSVTGTGSLVVGVRRRHVVGELSSAKYFQRNSTPHP